MREIHSFKVSVSGNVRMPGYFEVKTPDATVLDMIAKAQGLNEFADKGSIRVIRRGQNGAIEFKYNDAINGRERRQLHRPARRRHRRQLRNLMAREFMSPASDESFAVRMVAILRRRALIATVAFMTVLAAAIAFAVYLPDLYTASALVTIERPLPDGVVRTAVSNELESRLYQIRQEVLSRERLTGLIKRFNLYPELRKKTGFEDVLNQARDDIKWEPNGPEQVSGRTKTVAFTLTYTGTEQRSVADVTNAIAQFFVEHNSAMRAGEARRAVELLNGAARHREAASRSSQEARLRAFTAAEPGAVAAGGWRGDGRVSVARR